MGAKQAGHQRTGGFSQSPPAASGAGSEGRERHPPDGGSPAGSPPFRAKVTKDDPPELAAALETINGLAEVAREKGYPVPADELLEVAESQLRRLHGLVPARCTVSSGEVGEITLLATPVQERSILLALFDDGWVCSSVLVANDEYSDDWASVADLTDEELSRVIEPLVTPQEPAAGTPDRR